MTATLLRGGVVPRAGGKPVVRVVSWNLWWRYGPWEQRREAIAAALAEVGPDVCGLQEVWAGPGENLAADLAGRLGMHWCWVVAAMGRGTGGRELSLGNAILSRWPITAQAEVDLPVGDLEGEGRVAVHARIEAPAGRCLCSPPT